MIIYFYRTVGTHGCFSNFSLHPVFLWGKTWKTSEHAFQGAKFLPHAPELAEKIFLAEKPMSAANLGRTLSPLRSDWETKIGDGVIEFVKDQVMYDVCLAKFTQNEDARRILLSTADLMLVEDSPIDSYWGCGKDKKGANKLGKILQLVRDKLKLLH